MRTYYIFNINSFFSYMYKKNPYKLYKMLEEMFYSKEKDIILSYKYFEQIATPFNKNKLNEYITNSYENNEYYHKNNLGHIIINNNEYTKLVIGNAYLKIKSTINNPVFFKSIDNYNNSLLVCDFQNKDYFWLTNVIKNDCQNKEFIVQ